MKEYERALNDLLNGGVHYYWKWEERQLAEAVLELRRLALPALYDRESWFTWPPWECGHVLEVFLTAKDADHVRTGSYREAVVPCGRDAIKGLPDDEPVWLKSIFPSIVWTRIVPVAVIDRVRSGSAADSAVLNISDWVLSDRRPHELSRAAPGEKVGGWEPGPWSW